MFIALAAYAVGVVGRTIQALMVRWDADLPFDMLVGGSVGEGLAWPRDLIHYLL